jgi:hypothetical protein
MTTEGSELLQQIRSGLADMSRPTLHPAITEKLRAGQPLSPEQQAEYSQFLLSKPPKDLTPAETAYLQSGVRDWLQHGDPE